MKKLLLLFVGSLFFISCQESKKETMGITPEHKNEVVEAIKNRRSIRSYKPEQIDQAQLDTIIDCGINAPSALNRQSWEVRVIQNADLLKRINDSFVDKAKGKELKGSAARSQEPGFSVFHGAPTLIIVAKDKSNPYSAVDCGLLAQNILLSAESMDIGTCTIGNMASILNDPDAKGFLKEINMPDTHEVAFGIAIGYKNESPEAKTRDTSKVQYVK
ncbi:nitroreductase family protein [Dysgonomonas sp. HDW5A]|uniref:nitroreductase family protein n=1 Tax=Dysgonomonas sp. HDW5A TaxID=2714926 RepID=UPI001407DDA9|nr:nitroreductase [Dysgonomonas sp. HDW5A]QIK60356.1 nitroreductase family protein [Dysgonomonas sp. HDW5A]